MTAKPTLTDRYVSAAVKGIPAGQQEDIAAELQASVSDAVEDLVGHGMNREDAEVRALTQLGDPAALAARYGGRPQHLIGPGFFREYVTILTTVLAVVLPIIFVALLIAHVGFGSDPVAGMFSVVGGVFQVGVQVAFWITLIFAIVERTTEPAGSQPWTPDRLPNVVERRIGVGETAFSVAILSLLIWALLWQRTHWLVDDLPAINPDLWTLWMPALVVVLGASLVLEIVKYRIGVWTVPLAVVNTLLNAAFAGIVVWLWNGSGIVNPALALPEGVPMLLNAIPWVVVAISIFDTAEGWWKLQPGR